jgi:hypothetical protein
MTEAARPEKKKPAKPRLKDLLAIASWTLPPLFCLFFYWRGLRCWFRQDDFAWLQLTGMVHNWGDFWHAMFAPMAQGTIRPWSERAFFMALYTLFGLDALPFRICVFVTQIANLTLIRIITERLTGSAAAGVWAAILWTANGALIVVMTWSSVYNQALCGFFLLLAFYFLLRYIETGRTRFNTLQWVVFLLGFGALEINVVYPALAALYTLLCARPFFRRTLPLFIPSILFTIVHRAVAPPSGGPVYAMRFDATIFKTFLTYLYWARGINHYQNDTSGLMDSLWPWATALILGGLAVFVYTQVSRGNQAPLFFLGWFAILLLPVLPLPGHLSEYYLTLPTIGLAMLGGWGLTRAWRAGRAFKLAAAALLLLYFSALPGAWVETNLRFELSRRIERVVLGVEEARRLHPGRVILLRDADDILFWQALADGPFVVAGVSDVYLTPESAGFITPHPELGDINQFILPTAATLEGLREGKIVVYSVAGEKLKNITGIYSALAGLYLRQETPRRVDVANDLLAYLLGKTWYPREEHYRWMPKQATLRLGGPKNGSERLYLTGYCPREQWAKGPLPFSVTIDGIALSTRLIQPGTDSFQFDYALPASLAGRASVEVAAEVGRTFTEPDRTRDLGVVFGVFEIR